MRKGGVIVLLGALCFAAYVLYSLTGVEPVKVGDTRLIRSGDQVSVEGDVRNTGDDTGPLQVESVISIATATRSARTSSRWTASARRRHSFQEFAAP